MTQYFQELLLFILNTWLCTKKHVNQDVHLEGTIIQVGKSLYMFEFIQKQYPENFAYLIRTILELFASEVCKFLRK